MNALTRLDRTINLSEDEQMLLESVRALARDLIAPNAQQIDRTGVFPQDNVDAINALGLNAMFIPEAYGGAPMSYTAYLECVRELSRA
ncbi:MAG: acyl-CoA dehydrogenase family protein, partial [bacterium]